MSAFEVIDNILQECPKQVQVVTLQSAPTIQLARTVRIIGLNLAATAAATIFLNLGSFVVPVFIPAAATPVMNLEIEVHNGLQPIEVTDFSLPPEQIPAGFTGQFFLLIIEH